MPAYARQFLFSFFLFFFFSLWSSFLAVVGKCFVVYFCAVSQKWQKIKAHYPSMQAFFSSSSFFLSFLLLFFWVCVSLLLFVVVGEHIYA